MNTLLVVAVILGALLVLGETKRHDDDKHWDKLHSIKKHHHTKSRLRGAHLQLKEGGVKSLHDRWGKPSKDSGLTECVKTKCGHKEMCIVNPRTKDEKCVKKRSFRESRNLFRNFRKERTDMKNVIDSDLIKKELDHAEHMKDVYDLIDSYNKELKHSSHKLNIQEALKKGQSEIADLTKECKPQDMYDLKRRLVGWSVLQHTESRMQHHKGKFNSWKKDDSKKHFGKKPHFDVEKKDSKKHKITKRSVHDIVQTESHHHCKCSKSVMWEFRKQDKNQDGRLEHSELAVMESNKHEPCLHPLFKSCDTNTDGYVEHGEWCCCMMADTIPPCFEKKRHSDKKFYIPNCDREGFYHREQCLVDKSYCWCVDINGNEIMDTKRQGRASCGVYDPNGRLFKQ